MRVNFIKYRKAINALEQKQGEMIHWKIRAVGGNIKDNGVAKFISYGCLIGQEVVAKMPSTLIHSKHPTPETS